MFCVGGVVVVVVVHRIATLIVKIDAVVVAVKNWVLFTNFFTFFTFTVQFCVTTVVSVGLANGKIGSPQDFLRSQWQQFRQWQSGILRHFSRQSLVIGHQSKREEVVKVRQDKRICQR